MGLFAIIEATGGLIDAFGVLVMLIGLALATFTFFHDWRRHGRTYAAYHRLRQGVGYAILLGLEVLIVADIIRTVAVMPTLENLSGLAVIVLIRTFLSFSLHLEIEGRWPWQPRTRRSKLASQRSGDSHGDSHSALPHD